MEYEGVWIGAMRWFALTFLTSLLLCAQPSGDSLNYGNYTLLDDDAHLLRDEQADAVLIFVKEREFRYPRIKRGLTVPCLTCTVLNRKECCRKYSKCCDQNGAAVPQQRGQQVGQQQPQATQGNVNPSRKQTRPAIEVTPNAKTPQNSGNGGQQFLIRSGTCPALSRRNNAKLRAACLNRCYEDANCPVNAKCCPQPTMCCRQLVDNANCPAVLGPQTCTGCVTDQGCPDGTGCCPQAVNQGCCIIPCNRNRRPGVAANQPGGNNRPGVVINRPGANRPPGGVVTHTVYMAGPDPDTITETLGGPQATRPAGGGSGNTVVMVNPPGESVVTVNGPPPPVVITVDQTVGGNGPIVTVDQTQFVDGPVVTVDQTQTLFGPVVTVDKTVEVTKNPADGGAVETVVVVEDPNGNGNTNTEEVVVVVVTAETLQEAASEVVVVTAETLQEAASEVVVGSNEVEGGSGDGSVMISSEDDSTATFQSSPSTISSDGFLIQETLSAHVDSSSGFPDLDNTLVPQDEPRPDESTVTVTETEDVEEDPEDINEEPSATVSSDDHIVFVVEKDSLSADGTAVSESDTPLLQGSLSSNIGSGSVDTPPLKSVTTVTVH